MTKKNKIILIIVIILLTIIALFRLHCHLNEGKEELLYDYTLTEKQEGYEKEFNAEKYTFENMKVVLNPYKISPLTALIMFKTEEKEKVTIKINGKDNLTTYTHTFDEEKVHYIPVYGLYPDKENEITITCGDKQKTIKIQTEKLPDDFILPEKVIKSQDKLTNDLYFYTPSSKGYTCAYDTNGDVRWYLTETAIWEMNRLKNGHLLLSTERLVNTPYYTTGLYEMDMLGKIYTEYSLKGGYHHDYYEMEDGNLIVASNDFDGGTVEDYVVLLDRKTGKIIKRFDLKNILPTDEGKSENWIEYDWFHNNSVWYDKNTNSILLSGRHQDIVVNIDFKTGKLNWILGDSEGFSEKYQKYFLKKGPNTEWQYSQHAAMILPNGDVFLFDNGNNKSKNKENYVSAENSYSRGVIYHIDKENMTATQVFEYGKKRGSSFYSPYISDVDYLGENHYIIHSGGISYKNGVIQNQPAGIAGADELKSDTVELLDGEVIFELVLKTNNYRVEKMSLYEGTFSLGKAESLGSLDVTESDQIKFTPFPKTNQIDENYKKHNIQIKEEKDRLKITGTFKKGKIINIILYKDMMENIYNMRISKTPYTALCVDLDTDKETDGNITVTKYINKKGLIGKYTIFIEIDGKIYNTNYYLEA